jgi:hypothetical protein
MRHSYHHLYQPVRSALRKMISNDDDVRGSPLASNNDTSRVSAVYTFSGAWLRLWVDQIGTKFLSGVIESIRRRESSADLIMQQPWPCRKVPVVSDHFYSWLCRGDLIWDNTLVQTLVWKAIQVGSQSMLQWAHPSAGSLSRVRKWGIVWAKLYHWFDIRLIMSTIFYVEKAMGG